MTQWNTEPENVPEEEKSRESKVKKLGYKSDAKVFIVLENSDKETWGVVRDMTDKLFEAADEGDVVGSWSKASYDNLIHLSLTTSLNALVDKATQIWLMRAEQRKQEKVITVKGGRKRVPAPEPELSIDTQIEFNKLREKLRRAKE